MSKATRLVVGLLLIGQAATPVAVQQVVDDTFRPAIDKPAYPFGSGPVVLVDESHSNFSATGRYLPFAEHRQP